jgi:hypothetical protein
MFNQLLAGVSKANADVDTRGPGGTGRLIAGWGAGAAAGRAAGSEQARQENEAFKQAIQQYSMDRGRYAGDQARTQADYETQKSQIQLQNDAADQLAQYQQNVQTYGTQEANRRSGFEVDQRNRGRLSEFLERGRLAQQPTYDKSAQGIIETLPGQRPHIIEQFDSSGASNNNEFRQHDAALKGLYGPEAMFDAQFDIDWDNHNEIGARQNIMNAILAGGYGKSVFPDWYDTAVQSATGQVEAQQIWEPKQRAAAQSQALAEAIWDQITTTGDVSWIAKAALAGNRGALRYMQEGQVVQ